MRSPKLKELPTPLSNRSGWPWTEESPKLSDVRPNGSLWPKISIITPSYNQGEFIEETIRSVLLQGYPDIEYIIIDGGSTDKTLDIIEKYEKFLAYWVSEPDQGQTHAINKGIKRATGQIIGWINSDDVYIKGTFEAVVNAMCEHGRIIRPIIYGGIELVDKMGHLIRSFPGKPVIRERLITFWRQDWHIPQPTVFIQGDILRANPLNDTLHYAMDWELYLRLSDQYSFHHLKRNLARFRSHQESKTSGGWGAFTREQIGISKKYWGNRNFYYWLDFHLWPLTRKYKQCLGFLRKVFRIILGHQNYERAKSLKAKIFAP